MVQPRDPCREIHALLYPMPTWAWSRGGQARAGGGRCGRPRQGVYGTLLCAVPWQRSVHVPVPGVFDWKIGVVFGSPKLEP